MTYANSADPDQIAPEGNLIRVYNSTLFGIPLSVLRNNCLKSKIWAKNSGIKGSKFLDIYSTVVTNVDVKYIDPDQNAQVHSVILYL